MSEGVVILRKRRRADSQKFGNDVVDDEVPQVSSQWATVSPSSQSGTKQLAILHSRRSQRRRYILDLKQLPTSEALVAAASSASRSFSVTTPTTTTSTTSIQITHGCLLLPVLLAAWWYWTKRKARKVLRRLHLMAPPPSADRQEDDAAEEDGVGISLAYYQEHIHDTGCSSSTHTSTTRTSNHMGEANDPHQQDPFHSWDDVRHGSSSHGALRWVQWFKGRGGKTTQNQRRVQANTLHNLRQGPSFFEHEHITSHDEYDHSYVAAAAAGAENGIDTPGVDGALLAMGRRRAASVLARVKKNRNRTQAGSAATAAACQVGMLDENDHSEPVWQYIQDTMGTSFCVVPNRPTLSSTSSSSDGALLFDNTNGQAQHPQQPASTNTVVDKAMTTAAIASLTNADVST